MNQIASDEKFYFEVNGFQLKAEEQLNATPDDIRPKIEREAQDKQADKKSDDILDLGEELDRLGPKKDSGEAKLQKGKRCSICRCKSWAGIDDRLGSVHSRSLRNERYYFKKY